MSNEMQFSQLQTIFSKTYLKLNSREKIIYCHTKLNLLLMSHQVTSLSCVLDNYRIIKLTLKSNPKSIHVNKAEKMLFKTN